VTKRVLGMKETDSSFQALQAIMEKGLADSSVALSAMSTGGMRLQKPVVHMLPLDQVPGIAGGPARVVVAVYVGMKGDLSGHLMLLFQREAALRVVEMLMDLPPGSLPDLDEVGRSALAEVGNICCSACLSALANRTGLVILPTPPVVVTDMAGAILESVVTHLYLNGDESLVVETKFNEEVPGYFLLLPDQQSLGKLVAVVGTKP